jgi:hypothetical protein
MRFRRILLIGIATLTLAGCTSAKVGVNQTATTGAGSQTTASTPPTTASTPKVGMISSFMTGTAHPTIPPLDKGKVAILVTAPPETSGGSTTVPVMVGNGTSGYISRVEVSGPAVDPTGKVVGSGDSQGFVPVNVAPGEVSFGYAYFSSTVPAGATFQLKVTYDEGKSSTDANVQVTQANAGTDPNSPSIVGTVTNSGGPTVKNPIKVEVFCFDTSGALVGESGSFTDGSADLTVGAVASYDVSMYSKACPTFLAGSTGYTF